MRNNLPLNLNYKPQYVHEIFLKENRSMLQAELRDISIKGLYKVIYCIKIINKVF